MDQWHQEEVYLTVICRTDFMLQARRTIKIEIPAPSRHVQSIAASTSAMTVAATIGRGDEWILDSAGPVAPLIPSS